MRTPDHACLGVLVVDHTARTEEFFGMDGCGAAYDPHDCLQYAQEQEAKMQADRHEGRIWYLIFWKGEHQLSVHDLAGFEEECAHCCPLCYEKAVPLHTASGEPDGWHRCSDCHHLFPEEEDEP
jgi:hypothetical protein